MARGAVNIDGADTPMYVHAMNAAPQNVDMLRPLGALISEDEIMLRLLGTIEANENVSQRQLAKELNIALGLVNSYIRRCVRKSLVKVRAVPCRRYLYYLTPQGFSEKARLTGEYMSQSFRLFRLARQDYEQFAESCVQAGHHRLVIQGCGDLADIALMCLRGRSLTVVAMVGKDGGRSAGGPPVVAWMEDAEPFDAVVFAELEHPVDAFLAAARRVALDRIYVPDFLGLRKLADQVAVSDLA